MTHSQAQFSPQLSLPGGLTQAPVAPPTNGIKTEPVTEPEVKQEPGTQADGGMNAYPTYNGNEGNSSVAASRAAQALQAQYGQRAANSINALQDRMSGQQSQQQQGQQPQPSAPPNPAQLYRQQMAAATAQQQQQQHQQQHPHISNGQTDGAGDEDGNLEEFEGVLLRRSAAGELQELGRVEIDNLLHRHIAARAKSMEGGGVMVPLREATRHRTAVDSSAPRPRGVAGNDGADEEDEDAINSDLDDPEEDEGNDEGDDEGLGHIMLCMYDKVQRVKNKWYASTFSLLEP